MAKKIQKSVPGGRAQRALSVVALIGLVACGVMIGMGVARNRAEVASDTGMHMTEWNCRDIINRMTARDTSAEQLAELNKIYNDNCAGRVFDKPVVKEEVKDVAVQEEGEQLKETCVVVEEALLDNLPFARNTPDTRIERAKIYANLSERGCPENSAKYVEMAKQELAVARALEDDKFDEYETVEVVETYKRLNMQAAAEEIFETAKKLTDPAIDFIIQVEKIINEQ